MVTFGLDISHHQDLGLDLAQCRREGIDFVFIKSSEGSSFVDAEFAANLAEARNAGVLVAAYHYVRSNASAAAQVANVARVVPKDVPVIPDVEANSGGIGLVREFVDRLRAAGYRVPLSYIPRWYWQQIGSPSLAGLPPLWSSRYPDNIVGSLLDEWADVPGSYWNGYGGLDVAVLQFTSSVRIAGHQPLDANAFRGTRAQLAALMGNAEREDPMKNLILALEAGSPRVWVGDGLTRRHVEDEKELEGLQYWIAQRGGDPTIQQGFLDLRVLGNDISGTVSQLTDDESNIIAAIKSPTPVAIDYDKFVGDVVTKLAERLGSLKFDAEPPK
ncbi:glycoside hydrolase family 25 protein [Actinophytocola sp.]|jgi:GH25 family lysozyme M1 (1,4-beta-N-acetylmuramidase)|uniref:glycoside hydrolase family 25 protein n=1 Tax=Actinophytocola sp. TaxID=1872138 RepID=UPI002D29068D|nr:glycoside hydrolase family 25 protein [Actinophytocola sp.]HYQ66662.1 glycoside hydrolase family 25 protein [Actinophytocola sp.]